MSLGLMCVVLLAAALHAGWNAMVKSGRDKLSDVVLVAGGAALFAVASLPFLPLPAAASWPYLGASVSVHLLYFWLVGRAYVDGDLSHVYPLMRGAAPLIIAVGAVVLVGEPLRQGEYVGAVLLSAGVLALSLDGLRVGAHRLATAFALLNAVVITLYTLLDGVGVRLSGSALAYAQWLFFLNAFPLAALAFITRRGTVVLTNARSRWRVGLLGGLFTMASYGLVLWAMARAPIALVAALRETSVIFGTIIAAAILRERFGPVRYVAAGLVTAGAVAMKVL